MQLKSRIVHFFLVLLLGFVGFVSLLLLELFQHEPSATTVQLPKQAEWAMRFDPEQLVKDELYTLLFEAKDEQLITLLRKLADERIERHNEKGKLAIDFRQDVVVFGFAFNNKKYIGLQLEVLDPKLFRENIRKHLAKGYYAQVKDHTALILFSPDAGVIDGSHEKDMLVLAAELLRKTRKWERLSGSATPFLSLESSTFRGKDGKMTVNLYNEGQRIRMNGHLAANQVFETANYTLKSKGLYLNTSMIPAGFSDSLNKLLPKTTTFKLPELRAVALDYQGMNVMRNGFEVAPFPLMNLVLETTRPFSVDSLYADLPRDGKNRLQIAGNTYYLKQLDKNTVFIGLDTNAIIRQKADSPFTISGSAKAVGMFSGDRPTIMGLISLTPKLKFSQQFLMKTERIDFSMKPAGNGYTIEGKLLFRKDVYALHETIRLLIGIGVLD